VSESSTGAAATAAGRRAAGRADPPQALAKANAVLNRSGVPFDLTQLQSGILAGSRPTSSAAETEQPKGRHPDGSGYADVYLPGPCTGR